MYGVSREHENGAPTACVKSRGIHVWNLQRTHGQLTVFDSNTKRIIQKTTATTQLYGSQTTSTSMHKKLQLLVLISESLQDFVV